MSPTKNLKYTSQDTPKNVLAIDIGTSKITAVSADLHANGFEINAIGQAASQGLKKGMVTDVQKTIASIGKAIQELESTDPNAIKHQAAYIGISGAHIQSISSHGVSAIKGQEVTQDDIQSALMSAQAVRLSADQQLLHTFVQGFQIDGQEEIQDPIGMSGVRLELKVELIATGTTATQNVMKCIKRCGIESQEMIVNPFASSLSVLRQDEKELGVVVVDIGAGTCDIAIYYKGVMRYINVIPIAGEHITNDISIAMRMPMQEAEEVKIKYGVAQEKNVNPSEYLQVNDVGGAYKKISRKTLAVVIQSRLEEIFQMISQTVKQTGYEHMIASGYVFTGGVNTHGFIELASLILNNNCRIGVPYYQGLFKEMVAHPQFASILGTLDHAKNLQQFYPETADQQNIALKAAKKAWHWLIGTF
jgi:cell division protein FtsA